MDPSLWLLARLRINAGYRRWKRSLSRPRGILVSILFSLLFVPSIGVMVVMAVVPLPAVATDAIDRFGPIGFLALTLLSVGTSSGGSALYFGPSEVDFLFSGPYHRRQLVGYKLIMLLTGSVLSATFFALSARMLTPSLASAFCGSMLAVLFLQLSQMVTGLTLSLIGAIAWSRARRVGLVVLIVLATLTVLPSRESLLATDWKAVGLAAERSPITAVVIAPFRPFVAAFTAKSLSATLGWSSLALVVNLVLVGLVFALDAGYLEASATASAQRLAMVKKAIGGGGTIKMAGRRTGRLRYRPPKPAWWGGVGPNFWRQMTSAMGDPAKLGMICLLIGALCWFLASLIPHSDETIQVLVPVAAVLAGPITLLLSMFLSFDFRGDLDVIETLKTLPIPASSLALGQVLTPAILATLMQAIACLGMIFGSKCPPENWPYVVAVLAYLFPGNLFFFAVENLLFLWYPTRLVAGQFDGMAFARQMLLLLAKMTALIVAIGVVSAVGIVGYFATGQRIIPGLVLAWLTLLSLAIALMPILGRAFTQFDVINDSPA